MIGSRGRTRLISPGLSLGVALLVTLGLACRGRDEPVGTIEGERRSAEAVEREERSRAGAAEQLAALAGGGTGPPAKRILFGDLHVHTTYSIDAYIFSLPIFGGEGSHPPADACDFARHCSGLDFFSLNDHAEGLTPDRWQRSVESLRECNARAGDPRDPDLVAFVGWEWTQTGTTPETHFGHKNVLFPGLSDAELPARPIAALAQDVQSRARYMGVVRALQALRPFGFAPYADFLWWIQRLAETPICEEGVDTRRLPKDCLEGAADPETLFEKLAQWDLETLVIPHGTAWGIHAPPGARLDVQLSRARHVPEQQRLLEVYSGHGNSERYLPALRREGDPEEAVCRAPTEDFLPCCWQAGEIIRARCGDLDEAVCEERVAEARRLALRAGRRPHWVIPDSRVEDWLDCDQCRDCFKPVLSPRPRQSAQYALALSRPDETDTNGRPLRFRFGLMASSDNHSARAGSGYKQVARKGMSDARGLRSEGLDRWLGSWVRGSAEDPRRAVPSPPTPMGFRSLIDVERGASFMYPGGLVAVHAEGRDRRSIWDALVRREVYGTSGPRILLWFELLNGPDARRVPMGGALALSGTPRFEVRAAGARVQRPGCPRGSREALSPERLERLCRGECHHPGDERHRIAAIEVVRIRPRIRTGEPIEALVQDPWRRIPCPPDPSGCTVRFEDPDFAASGRDALYYVRALQEETPAVNGDNLRTRFDARGRALSVEPCYGGFRTAADDDCLAPVRERAWSSPIFVDFGG